MRLRHADRLVLALAALLALGTAVPTARAQETAPGSDQTQGTGQTQDDAAPAVTASAQTASGSQWPCDQPERAEISVGSFWSGPDPSAATENWRDQASVAALVAQIAPRRLPQDEAIAAIHRFAAGFGDPAARAAALTAVFAGLFDSLDKERGQIIRGIRHFNRRQDALSQRIEEGWKAVDALDPNSTDPAIAQQRLTLQQAIDWDSRIFDDRQHLLPQICQQPSVIEQRLFALARAIQQDLPNGSAP